MQNFLLMAYFANHADKIPFDIYKYRYSVNMSQKVRNRLLSDYVPLLPFVCAYE